MNLSRHRLPIIEECIKALANCREVCSTTTVISSHMMRMTREEVLARTKHDLAHRLAVLLINHAEITEGIVWADRPRPEPYEIDTEFSARTVVMKASTYHALCQALNHLLAEAQEDNYPQVAP